MRDCLRRSGAALAEKAGETGDSPPEVIFPHAAEPHDDTGRLTDKSRGYCLNEFYT